MKKHLVACLTFFLTSQAASAFETTVGGFVSLDLLDITKIDDSRQKMHTGVGALDLKVFVRKERTRFKLKLDLDDSKIGNAYNIFEEALLTREFSPWLSFDIGKGVVAFHRKHWAVIMPSYFDGGSIIGGYHWTYTDIDNKMLVAVSLGSPKQGFRNTLTFWGDPSLNLKKKDDGSQSYDDKGEPVVEAGKSFEPRDQRGIANRFDCFIRRGFSVNVSAVHYWHKLNPHANYAFDIGADYEQKDFSLWFEALNGTSSSFFYNYEDREENLGQVGGEYRFTESLAALADAEVAFFRYKNSEGDQPGHVDGDFKKVEAGVRYGFDKLTYWTNGVAWEQAALNSSASKDALRFGSSFSHWF